METHVILRGYRSGVHYGVLECAADDVEAHLAGKSLIPLKNARRVWRWHGAQTLSELAVYGGSDEIENCIAQALPLHYVDRADVSEVILCHPAAVEWFARVPVWQCSR